MQVRGVRVRVGDNKYAGGPATVAGPLETTKELAVRRVWQKTPTAPPQLLAQRHPEGLQARLSGVLGES